MSKTKRECARSDRSDWAVWDGCDAVYFGGDGGSGDRYGVQREPDGGVSEFRQQDLERGAVHVHERGPGGLGPAARRRAGMPAHTSHGVAGFQAVSLEDRWILSRFNRAAADVNASLQNYRSMRRPRGFTIFLGRVLRLVSGADQAAVEFSRKARIRLRHGFGVRESGESV